jgi:hypothetical protein
MAVFTDITDPDYRKHLLEIERAFNLTIYIIEEITAGSSDTNFKIFAKEFDEPLVLTIFETPDVTPAGLTSEKTQKMLLYVSYLANTVHHATDRLGRPVNVHVLKLLEAYPQTINEAPFLELTFAGVKKTVSCVPFIQGRSFLNTPEELVDPHEAFLAGKALAAYLSVSQSYPEPALFDDFEFEEYVSEINRIANNREGLERLGYVLSNYQLQESDAEEMGWAYISEMKECGLQLLHSWHKLSDVESTFQSTLIHGDLFTDNAMIDESGRFILLDFNETCYGSMGLDVGIALNSWASQNGLPVMENVINFLRAFDEVIPLNDDAISLIPFFAQIGAYRWETFRIQRIEMQDPRQQLMRSPEEFQSLRHAWREVQALFNGARSVHELALEIRSDIESRPPLSNQKPE